MDPNILGLLCIVLFAVYPFAMLGLASVISSHPKNRRYRNKYAEIFACIGALPAALLILSSISAKVPSVAFVAAGVLILCFYSTGALLGSLADRAEHADHKQTDA